MIEIGALVVLITAFSLFLQEKLKIPSPITLLSFILISKLFGINPFDISLKTFDQIILLLLPVLITIDALSLKIEDIRKNAVSLFYMAGLSVVLTVIAGALLNHWVLPSHNITTPALILLFCMVAATDPITVSSIFKNFSVPHELKILAEGESLFNDVTALIIFGLAISYISGHEPTILDATINSMTVFFGAIIIGFSIGISGLFFLALTKNPMIETFIMLSISFVSFSISEHFHVSGILAIIVSILTANHIVNYRIKENELVINEEKRKKRRYRVLSRISQAFEEKANQLMIEQNIRYTAILGTSVLFLSIGDMVSIKLMIKYWKEITSVFIATTIIRAAILSKFAIISNSIGVMQNISIHWWLVLIMSGSKGGLSILMIHMLPKNFAYLELFDSIIVGNIILGTLIYPLLLTIIFKKYKNKFELDSK